MSKGQTQAKRRGRPPKPIEEAKRWPLKTRTTKEMFERIVFAAKVSGRSVAQEIEHRLEQSFQGWDLPPAPDHPLELMVNDEMGAKARELHAQLVAQWVPLAERCVAYRKAEIALLSHLRDMRLETKS
jgi:hypothetical protein